MGLPTSCIPLDKTKFHNDTPRYLVPKHTCIHIVYEIHPKIEDCGGPERAALLKDLSVLERAKLAIHTYRTLTELSDENLAEKDGINKELRIAKDVFQEEAVDDPTQPDHKLSEAVLTIADPETTQSKLDKVLPRVYKYTRPEVKRLDVMLSTLDEEIVHAAVRLRAYTTNKLLDLTENPDPKVRIKALELLGKIKDVGLFSEKLEITHKAKSDEEIEAEIRKKLEVFMGGAVEIEDAEEIEEDEEASAIGVVDTSVDLDSVFELPTTESGKTEP